MAKLSEKIIYHFMRSIFKNARALIGMISILGFITFPVSKCFAKSNFEELVEANQNQIPTQFDQLLTTFFNFRKDDIKISETETFFVPYGRSLQKDKTDFKNPRLISGHDKTFIGYAPNAEQLEVISWNRRQERFDFLLVKDYAANKSPRILKADRQLCMTCHQSGGPIFAQGNWREILGEPGTGGIFERMQAANVGKKTYHGIPFNKFNAESSLMRLVFGFDRQIRLANQDLQTANIWKNVCGNSVDCRRYLLKFYFLSRGMAVQDNFDLSSLFAAMTRDTWPADSFAMPSSVLPDRMPPELAGLEQGFYLFDRNHANQTYVDLSAEGRGFEISQMVDRSRHRPFMQDEKAIVERVMSPSDMQALDPKFARPFNTVTPVQAANQILGSMRFYDVENILHETLHLSNDQIKGLLNSDRFDELLTTWPNDLAVFRQMMLKAFGASQTEVVLADDEASDESKIQVQPNPKNQNLFVQYCARCHATADSIGPYLPLANISDLANNPSVADFIQKKIMPLPLKDVKLPSDEERAQMLKLLQAR